MISTLSTPIAVAGGGSWGTALAHVLARAGHKTTIILRDARVAEAINSRHENTRYLPGKTLHRDVQASTNQADISDCHIAVLAVPCQQQRHYLASIRPYLQPGCVIVNASKGIETESNLPMSQVVSQALTGMDFSYAVLSGPSFAAEVMDEQPTVVVLGCADENLAPMLRTVFSTACFRCYSSPDVTGVELGGALKNVIALAAGICDGLGFGTNSRAALITRGLAEISRIGVAMGANPLTFMGLSGLGDLTLTCTGALSRNRTVGLRLGQGESLPKIIASLGMVAEGVKTAGAALRIAKNCHVSAPITETVCKILDEGISARDAVRELMGRSLKNE